MEFVSGGSKTYGLQSFSGLTEIVKAKAFLLVIFINKFLILTPLKALTENAMSLTENNRVFDPLHSWNYH